MRTFLRYGLIASGIAGLIGGVVFYTQSPLVQDFWPWTSSSAGGYGAGYGGVSNVGLPPLSNFFIASIIIATSLPPIWIGFTGETAALRGGAINLSTTFFGAAIFTLQSYVSASHNQRLLVGLIVCGAIFGVSTAVLFASRNAPFKDTRPMPKPVRISFVIFIAALVTTGMALVLKMPNIFPWTIPVEASVVYGWIFIGAAGYFLDGFLRPYWHNACGQLLGFLGYDLVLIVPFLRHFATVQPEHRLSLIVYTAVLIFSGGLAVYYLFLHPATRIWRARIAATAHP